MSLKRQNVSADRQKKKKKKIEEIYFPWLFICDYRKDLQFDFVILINFYLVPTNVHLWS